MRNFADELGVEPYKSHLGCGGVYYIDQVRIISEAYSSKQNVTLIAEHKMMMEALEDIANHEHTGCRSKIISNETLKKLGR